jgi:hypothetical protein
VSLKETQEIIVDRIDELVKKINADFAKIKYPSKNGGRKSKTLKKKSRKSRKSKKSRKH